MDESAYSCEGLIVNVRVSLAHFLSSACVKCSLVVRSTSIANISIYSLFSSLGSRHRNSPQGRRWKVVDAKRRVERLYFNLASTDPTPNSSLFGIRPGIWGFAELDYLALSFLFALPASCSSAFSLIFCRSVPFLPHAFALFILRPTYTYEL